ncbi:potassium channel family protein [Bacillus benzoevorans]|uniref:Voltage-gated potassium channel n=1 Tax=Bacillus benzoevorans TaxID=1456 RepID=A0A7X0LUH9_9BACI|nr:potassium channel protein [Bacillus benzoevorans]MBB6444986.1 voltage-gated potassium channel [Bacillus benzoevorans]
MPHTFLSHFIRLPLILRTFIIVFISIFGFGMIMHQLEPAAFPTIFDGIWWAVITASTVGYGDLVPETIPGRFAGIILILTGAGFLSSFFVSLAATTVTKQNDILEGKSVFKGSGHMIIIGWNERSKGIIHTLCRQNTLISIALVDESLEKNPLSSKNVHFIKGRSNQDEVLIKAGIMKASKVIITADQDKGELQADMHSIITLLAVKGLNTFVPCIVEILTHDQIENAKRAGADEIIETNIVTSFIMLQSISTQDMVTSFLDLLYQMSERKLMYQDAPLEDIDKDYTTIGIEHLKNGVVLLGIKRGEATILNPPQPFSIEKNDQLILIRSS